MALAQAYSMTVTVTERRCSEKSKHAATQKTLQEKEQALADTAKALDEERKLRKQKEAELAKQMKAFD